MAASCFRGVQYLTAFMLVVSFALIITAGVVKFWWVASILGLSTIQKGESTIFPTNNFHQESIC